MDERKPTSSQPGQPIEPVTRAARRKLPGRKLLVASIGVATMNYAAACGYKSSADTSSNVQPPAAVDPGTKDPVPPTSGNLAPPNPPNPPPTAANLVAPPIVPPTSGNMVPPPTAANLVAPPLLDAGNDGTDAGDDDGGR
jgi:hypothetical protein